MTFNTFGSMASAQASVQIQIAPSLHPEVVSDLMSLKGTLL